MPYIINSSPVKTGGSSYDRTIKTQADFDSFCSAITNGTMTDKRILFVGDGGTLVFTKELGGVLLPSNVCEIKGVNNAKISVGEVESDSAFGIAYGGTITNEKNVVIDGLYVEVVSNQLSVVGIKNFFNVNNCFVYSESYGAGASSTGFYGCKNLENCSTYVGSTGIAYDNCDKLVNCVAEEYEILYKNCTNVGALTDASNLTEENVESWQNKLGVPKDILAVTISASKDKSMPGNWNSQDLLILDKVKHQSNNVLQFADGKITIPANKNLNFMELSYNGVFVPSNHVTTTYYMGMKNLDIGQCISNYNYNSGAHSESTFCHSTIVKIDNSADITFNPTVANGGVTTLSFKSYQLVVKVY